MGHFGEEIPRDTTRLIVEQITAVCRNIIVLLDRMLSTVIELEYYIYKHTHTCAIDPKYRLCSVDSIKTVTYDTKLFTLRLKAGSFLQVPTGHHVTIRANADGEQIERDYTPVNSFMESTNRQPQAQLSSSETIQMMIKLYKDGKMSNYLEKLKVGKHNL